VLGSGLVIAVVMAAGHATPAAASRPATAVELRRTVAGIDRHDEVRTGRYVSGGGRGGRADRAARSESPRTPTPTTRQAGTERCASLAVQATPERRRAPDSRAPVPAPIAGRVRGLRVVTASRNGRAPLDGTLAYDAHAPPSSATSAVAGFSS
jgi:hypothetical protein